MLGDLATTVLVMLFGYAYPAFECFKTLEQRQWPGEIEQLRFWCQYWVIVAIVTVIEKFGDPFISWLPMYGEAKLAFFVYLWYPKTKGSNLLYEGFLRPLVMQYEPNIEQRLKYLRAKSGELLVFYIKNFADKGTAVFFEVLNYVISRSSSASNNERNGRSGSSGLSRFFSFRRSGGQAPAPAPAPAREPGVHGRPNVLSPTAEWWEEGPAADEFSRAGAKNRRPRRHQ